MKNTMGIAKFILLHIVFLPLLIWGYISVFFRSLWFMSYEESRVCVCAFLILAVGCGMASTIKKRRSGISVFSNFIFAFLPVIFITYFNELKYIFFGFLIVSAVFAAIIFIKVNKKPINDDDILNVKLIKKNRMRLALFLCKTFSAFTSVFVIIYFLVITVFLPFSVNYSLAHFSSEKTDADRTTENHYRELSVFLYEDEWDNASLFEIAGAMQLLMNIEAELLELDDVPALRINNIQNDMYGVYSKETNTITVFIPKHHPAEKIMETIIHELRHAYQHQLVREYEELDAEAQASDIYNDARIFKEEFENYAELAETGYNKLYVENDARNYAFDEAERITKQIRDLLNKEA